MQVQEQLSQRRFAEVGFEATQQELDLSLGAYDGFLSLPMDYKIAGDYIINQSTTGKFGYFRRVEGSEMNGRRAAADTKHIYHFGTNTRQAFEAYGWNRLPSEVREFCDRVEPVYWLGVACLKRTLDSIYEDLTFAQKHTNPQLTPAFLDPLQLLNVHLRLLAYELPKDPNEPVAKGHFDRSVFTLALAETEPGLEIGANTDGSDLVPVSHSEGKAKFFAGKGWSYMPKEYQDAYSFIRPGYHRVNNPNLERTSASPIVRRALVMFANSLHFNTDPSIEDTRPLQLMEAAA